METKASHNMGKSTKAIKIDLVDRETIYSITDDVERKGGKI